MQQLYRACANKPRWRDTEQSPAVKRSRVVFLNITEEASRACMSATSKDTALDLNSDAMLGYSIIEPPTPCRVEAIFTDALATEITFNQPTKQVLCDRIVLRVTLSCYFIRFLRLSHFISFFV